MAALSFSEALVQAEAQARSTLDVALHERLSAAVSLVTAGRVFQSSGGAWEVDSSSQEGKVYAVNGSCPCDDVHFNHPPKGLCKHRIGVYLARRVAQLLQQPPAPVVPAPALESVQPIVPEAPHGIDARHIVLIRQKPFVRYSGLLQMAYAQGLIRLETTFISVTADLALAQCTATFAGGRVVTDVADSTPGNVGATVKLHWPRLAATRAAARALRNALAIDMCALEELTDEEGRP